MSFFADIAVAATDAVRHHSRQVALAIVSSILFIYGEDINGLIRRQVRRHHFMIRLTIFVLVCAFGYGMLAVLLTIAATRILANVGNAYLIPLVLLVFIIVGVLAERKRQI